MSSTQRYMVSWIYGVSKEAEPVLVHEQVVGARVLAVLVDLVRDRYTSNVLSSVDIGVRLQ